MHINFIRVPPVKPKLIYSAILIKALIVYSILRHNITWYPYFLILFGLGIICYKKLLSQKEKNSFPTYKDVYYHSFTTRLHSRHFLFGRGDILFAYGIIGMFLNLMFIIENENLLHLGRLFLLHYYTCLIKLIHLQIQMICTLTMKRT